jgi:hypothetical protein
MASSEERMMILRMVEEGKLSPDEGARLLTALGERQAEPEMAGAAAGMAGGFASSSNASSTSYGDTASYSATFDGANSNLTNRVFRVRVTNGMTGKQKVDINIPLSLVDFGLRFVPQSSKMDVQKVRDAIYSGVRGRIVDVMDNEKGDHVEIFIE